MEKPTTDPAMDLALVPRTPVFTLAGNLLRIVLAFAYATILTSLPLDAFLDRNNYFAYIFGSDVVLLWNRLDGWSTVLTNEPLWLLANIVLSRIMSPDAVLQAFIFVPAFVTALVILRRRADALGWLVLFLLMPLVVKNHIIHLRQGVAIALFLWGYFAVSRRWGLAVMISAAFVHSSFFFVLLILLMTHASGKLKVSLPVRLGLFALFFVVLGLMIGALSSGLGARQASDYSGIAIEVSGFAFLFWAAILALLITAGRDFIAQHVFSIALLAFYLVTYFLIVVSGRIFESAILLILLAGLSLDEVRRKAFLGLILLFTVANYASRLSEPWLGWGV